jgi:hypothetical protein
MTVSTETTSDVTVVSDGTITTFHAHSDEAKEWIEENVEVPDYMCLRDGGFHCESRYADDIHSGMLNAGLDVE